jgi:hypothetical protein
LTSVRVIHQRMPAEVEDANPAIGQWLENDMPAREPLRPAPRQHHTRGPMFPAVLEQHERLRLPQPLPPEFHNACERNIENGVVGLGDLEGEHVGVASRQWTVVGRR